MTSPQSIQVDSFIVDKIRRSLRSYCFTSCSKAATFRCGCERGAVSLRARQKS